MNNAAIWTVENATACIATYGAKADEYEAKARELVHAPEWLASFVLTAKANRREEQYCRNQLERLNSR
jgi:hypothetical protein